jgi:hypothetical protein
LSWTRIWKDGSKLVCCEGWAGMEIEAHVSCRAGFLMSLYMSCYFSRKGGA